jgi:hypothetical protein
MYHFPLTTVGLSVFVRRFGIRLAVTDLQWY